MHSIGEVLQQMKADREFVRMNPDNPRCPVCDRREEADRMTAGSLDGQMICAECADDQTWLLTGCRFGHSECDHDDCK